MTKSSKAGSNKARRPRMNPLLNIVGLAVTLVGFGLAGCGGVAGSGDLDTTERDSASGTHADRLQVDGSDRVTTNPMNQSYGIGGRPPSPDEQLVLSSEWSSQIPATNEQRPPAFPRVDYRDASFEDFQAAEAALMEKALDAVTELTGVGPWTLDKKGAGECGPRNPNSRAGSPIGTYASFRFSSPAQVSEDQFEQVVAALEEHYPGLTAPGNIVRIHDDAALKSWTMASDRDDNLMVTYNQDQERLSVWVDTACFITLDDAEKS